MFIRAAVGIGLVLGATSAALAADIAAVMTPPPVTVAVAPRPAVPDWRGFYFGGVVGADITGFCRASEEWDPVTTCPPDTAPPYNDPAAPYLKLFVGAFAGINFEPGTDGRLIVGLDAMAGTDLPLSFFDEPAPDIGIAKAFVRGRVGFALSNHFMVYTTAGLAVVRHRWSAADPINGIGVGWTLGGGAEMKTDGGFGIRLDYAFHRVYGLDQYNPNNQVQPGPRPDDWEFDAAGHTFTLGVFKLF